MTKSENDKKILSRLLDEYKKDLKGLENKWVKQKYKYENYWLLEGIYDWYK